MQVRTKLSHGLSSLAALALANFLALDPPAFAQQKPMPADAHVCLIGRRTVRWSTKSFGFAWG